MDSLDDLEEKQVNLLHDTIKRIETTMEDVKEQSADIAKKIDEIFQELQDILTNHKKLLLERASSLKNCSV